MSSNKYSRITTKTLLEMKSKGEKIAMGSYILGKKNGQWFFWMEENLIEVVYQDNVVLNKVEWGNKNKLVLNDIYFTY